MNVKFGMLQQRADNELKAYLRSEFEIKDLGETKKILDMETKGDRIKAEGVEKILHCQIS